MKKFVVINDNKVCWIVEAENKHTAISKAVEVGYAEDMSDFYYGLDDGQIKVIEVVREVI